MLNKHSIVTSLIEKDGILLKHFHAIRRGTNRKKDEM